MDGNDANAVLEQISTGAKLPFILGVEVQLLQAAPGSGWLITF